MTTEANHSHAATYSGQVVPDQSNEPLEGFIVSVREDPSHGRARYWSIRRSHLAEPASVWRPASAGLAPVGDEDIETWAVVTERGRGGMATSPCLRP